MRPIACGLALMASGVVSLRCERAEQPNRGPVQGAEARGMEPRMACSLDLAHSEAGIVASLRFENHSQVAVSIPRWKLVTDGKLTWAAFEVTREARAVPYRCITIKRGEPSKGDLVVIRPGDSFETETVISLCYDFAQDGAYSVRYRGFISVPNDGGLVEIVSNVVMRTVQ